MQHRPSDIRKTALIAAAVAATLGTSAHANPFAWVGPATGNWNVPANWDPAAVPNNAAHDVTINPAGGASVAVNGAFSVNQLTLGASSGVGVNSGQTFSLFGDVANAGTLTLNGTNSNTRLNIRDDLTVSGPGEIVIATTGASASINAITSSVSGFTLTNASGHTIRSLGQGSFGLGIVNLNNQGLVLADGAAAHLFVNPHTLGVTNTGTLRADVGQLTLQTGPYANAGGVIEGINGGFVNLAGANITGGTLAGNSRSTNNSSLASLAHTGSHTINNGVALTISDIITNTGTFTLGGTNSNTRLLLGNDVTLAGTGEVRFGSAGNAISINGITAGASGRTLTNTANHTIRAIGQGSLGLGVINLNNQGLVLADGADANLAINPHTNGVNNTGILRANAGTLALQSGTFTNTGGLIEAVNDGQITFNGTSLTSGTLAGNSRTLGTATFTNVSHTGSHIINNGAALTLAGTIQNTGTLTLAGTSSNTRLLLGNDVTLAGNGLVVIGSTGNAISINGITAGVSGRTLTNTANHTIRATGRGSLGLTVINLDNAGLVVADGPTGSLVINPHTTGVNNTGTLRADVGLLTLQSGTFNNTGGLIEAVNNGEIRLEFANITGGTLAGPSRVINSSTLSALAHTGTQTIDNGVSLTLDGTIANTGVITLAGTNSNTRVLVGSSGDATLAGTGQLVIEPDGTSATINGIASTVTGRTLTNGPDHTIRAAGQGNLGLGVLRLVNDGIILNDGTGTLTIQPFNNIAGGMVNNGLVSATGGNIALAAATYTNNGTIQAVGSNISSATTAVFTNFDVPNATLTGGTWRAAGSNLAVAPTNFDLAVNNASLDFAGSYNTTLFAGSLPDGVSTSGNFRQNNGSLRLADNATIRTTPGSGTFTNAGDVILDTGGTLELQAAGLANTGVFRGNGSVLLSGGQAMTNDGTLAPGRAVDVTIPAAGTLTVVGNLVLSTGAELLVDVGGTESGEFDVLSISGNLTLGGLLTVALFDNFLPDASGVFVIADSVALAGTFSNVAAGGLLQTAGGEGFFRVNYGPESPFNADQIVLSNFDVIPEPAGTTAVLAAGTLVLRRRRA